jgi:hypothetical protein
MTLAGTTIQGAPLDGGRPFARTVQPWLWIAAIVAYGFGDTLTSILVFQTGGYEANVFLRLALNVVGPTLWGFIAIKAAAILGLTLIARWQRNLELVTTGVMVLAGSFLVAQNVTILVVA